MSGNYNTYVANVSERERRKERLIVGIVFRGREIACLVAALGILACLAAASGLLA